MSNSVYNAEAIELMHRLGAEAVVIIVANGVRGSGMAAACDPDFISLMPGLLRMAADASEKSPDGHKHPRSNN